LLKALPKKSVAALSATEIGFECDETEFRSWLERQVGCLRLLLDGFYDAEIFGEVVAHLIGMDISLCALLLGVSKQRMNPSLSV
jgi:hypothetical protein